ncbi:hypothetical protein PHMEG_00012840 [Phytophthora megakarya]|uniref:Uncharacterized protein n=1 Tax=Phytophthora megakarya TaxID=4795 RepID=A0A225W8R0_9STRA|nr:hypothetical protein PHMEG_00012840 [Phytophthora megakarya]
MPLDLCAVSQTRDRLSATLQYLRRQLAEKYKRIEHRRCTCGTTLMTPNGCTCGLVEVPTIFLAFTSLTSLFDQFEPHYPMTSYNGKGGRPHRLRHHHQVLGVMMALYDDCLD